MGRRGCRCLSGTRGEVSSPRFGGPWTEEKLEILRAYLDAYTTALKNLPFTLIYVDGFAGAGSYRASGSDYEEFDEFRKGSTRIALEIADKPFNKLIFIEQDASAAEALLQMTNEYPGRQIKVVQGDANQNVPQFCRSMADFDRAVVFLDPYKTEVSWTTVETIATTQKIDCWILFPLMAVSRMMTTDKEPKQADIAHLDRIFGGREYWEENYQDSPQMSLWDEEPRRERGSSQQIALSYKRRLKSAFHSVAPTSRTLKNSRDSPLFELFFAAGNPKGSRIAMDIAGHILQKL